MQHSSEQVNSISSPKSSAFMPLIPVPKTTQTQAFSLSEENSIKLKNTYEKYLDLHKQKKVLESQLYQAEEEKRDLQKKYLSFQTQKVDTADRKKRHRRTATEIVKDYDCPVEDCNRTYGSDSSLIQHIKIKHKEYHGSGQYSKMVEKIHRKNREGEEGDKN